MTPNRPYFLRALHQWIVDNRLTPHIVVDATVPGAAVPQQYVTDGKIVLNISPDSVINLAIANDWMTFDARFSGVTHRIRLPMMAITAIYALENGRGMVFDEESMKGDGDGGGDGDGSPPPGRPTLKVVK